MVCHASPNAIKQSFVAEQKRGGDQGLKRDQTGGSTEPTRGHWVETRFS